MDTNFLTLIENLLVVFNPFWAALTAILELFGSLSSLFGGGV